MTVSKKMENTMLVYHYVYIIPLHDLSHEKGNRNFILHDLSHEKGNGNFLKIYLEP